MKINETARHYISMFSGYGLLILVALGGWELSEHSEWFATLWASESNRWIISGTLVIGMPMLLFFTYSYFWGHRKLIQTFKQIARFHIEDCKDNQVIRIQGSLVLLPYCFQAPFSQRECGAYSIRAMESVTIVNGQSRTEEAWQTIKYSEESTDFLIQCDDHFALIRTANAKTIMHVDLVHDQTSYDRDTGGFLSTQEKENRASALGSLDIEPKQYLGVYAKDIKFEEAVLQSGEQVAVTGQGVWIETKDFEELKALQEKGIAKVFELRAKADQELIISDVKCLIDGVYEDYNFRHSKKSA